MSDPITILKIPIRPDLEVHIAFLPWNLTEAEADKIARVILAHASSCKSADAAELTRDGA